VFGRVDRPGAGGSKAVASRGWKPSWAALCPERLVGPPAGHGGLGRVPDRL